MSNTIYEVDPDGDVVLILRNPNAPFAVWGENEELHAALVPDPWEPSAQDQISGLEVKIKKLKGKEKQSKRAIPSFMSLDPGTEPEPAPEEEPSTLYFDDEPPPPPPLDDEPAPPLDDEYLPPLDDEPPPSLEYQPAAEDEPAVEACDVDVADNDEEVEVRIRLSSKHLTLASAYFKKMLQGSWKEHIASTSECQTINASEWDVQAMLILMNIIHGRVRSVPRSINLEMLARIAVLVDYYKCHEVVELFADCWIQNLSGNLPEAYDRVLVLWLAISWVFSKETIFSTITKIAVKESKEPLQTLDLPIPQCIVETIDQQRQELVDWIISAPHNLLSHFYKRTKCSFACTSMLTGALTTQMHTNGLLDPKPARPFLGYSVAGATTIVRGFKSPKWSNYSPYSRAPMHVCTLATFMDPTIDGIVYGIEGLKLGEFQAS